MTVANGINLSSYQHLVLHDVSWEFYEQLLREVGDRHIQITYDDGSLEIMSPLPEHERWGAWIARLIELMCLERSIDCECLGSTTFRDAAKRKGLEPDECYYFINAARAREMEEQFDPDVDPVPELALEIDITNRSVAREPIYAALGVPEIWRFNGSALQVRQLSSRRKYMVRSRSRTFPFLPLAEFSTFVLRMSERNQLRVLREFRTWVTSLPE